MTVTYNKDGKLISETPITDYPYYHKVEKDGVIRWYKTVITSAGKMAIVAATEQDIKLLDYIT